MNFQMLEKALYKYTNGWILESGSYPLQDKKELEDAFKILKDHYDDVSKNHLDIRRKEPGGTVDYKVEFNDPKTEIEEDLDDDELIYLPNKNPSAGPMGRGTGMMEELDDDQDGEMFEPYVDKERGALVVPYAGFWKEWYHEEDDYPVLNESSTSRIYQHLSDNSTCAIISAFRSENDLKTNLELFKNLKKDVRDLGLGYVEFTSRWVEDGESFDEKSILIPKISYKDAYKLSDKYNQASFIFKSGNSCKEYCTHAFENYRPGDIVRTFNNVGPKMLNLEDAKEIFARRKSGPASKAKNAAPFNLQVIEKFEGKPTTFRGPKEYIVLDIDESIEKHDDINRSLFNKNNKLHPEVRAKILEVVDRFKDNLKEDGIELEEKDIIIVGSNASYNYTKNSDIDVHIVADMSLYDDADLAYKLYSAYKRIFNSKYSPTIKGQEIEVYVDADTNKANSNGVYSVMKDEWIKVPDKDVIPEVDMDEVNYALEPFEEKFNNVMEDPTIENIDDLIDEIYVERQKGILSGGEYSIGNLTFKEFRNKGYLQELKDMKTELETKEMSLF